MDLYRYSSTYEKFQVWAGLIFSALAGVTMPTYGIIIGKVVEMFDPRMTQEEQKEMLHDSIVWMIVLTLALFGFSYGSFSLL